MCTSRPGHDPGKSRTKAFTVIVARVFLAIFLYWTALAASAQAPTTAPATSQSDGTPASQSVATPQTGTAQTAADTKSVAEITTRQEIDTTLKVNVNLVVVRVVVRDAQGRAVGTLKKDDFRLSDNGKLQTIARFAVEQTQKPVSSGTGSNNQQAEGKLEAPARYVAYLFDDMHLTPSDITTTRNAAIAHLNALPPEDRAAVYTTSGTVMVNFTDDRVKLRDALMRINPSPIAGAGTSDCPYLTPYHADLIVNKHDPMALQAAVADYANCLNMIPGGNMAQSVVESTAQRVVITSTEQARVALGTLRDVINKISTMPGPRTIVLVSPGFLLFDNTQREADTIDRALYTNVVISTLDARGLYTGDDISRRNQSAQTVALMHQYAAQSASESSNVLSELAYGTGGTYVHNTNDLAEGLRRTSAMPEYYCVLGFAPQNLKNDGKFHSLKVTLAEKQPYTLQARKGYYAPSQKQDATQQAKSDINDAIFSQDERKDVPLQLHTKYFKTSDDNAKLTILVNMDVRRLHYQKVDGRNRNELTVVSALFDRNGNFLQGDQKTLEMHLTDETFEKKLESGVTLRVNFDVKPGSYLVRCVVRDTEGQMSAANDSVEIP